MQSYQGAIKLSEEYILEAALKRDKSISELIRLNTEEQELESATYLLKKSKPKLKFEQSSAPCD